MASYHEAKICILGDSGVGKSSLVQRFVHNTFTIANESTIGASFLTKTLVVGDKTIKFNIWDTAGQEKYRALAPMYYRGSQACVVVYDVTSSASYRSVTSWIRELLAHAPSDAILAIAANKVDLASKFTVPVRDAKMLADKYGAIFFETSAKNSMNVNPLFLAVAHRIKFNEMSHSKNQDKIMLNDNTQVSNDLQSTQSRRGKCC